METENYPKVLSFSGGQTSGYMLWLEIQKIGIEQFNKEFTVLFCNTGKEHDKTLDFVHEVETKWGVNVVWLEYTRVDAKSIDPLLVPEGRKRGNLIKQQEAGETAHWFKVVDYATAKRRNEVGPFDEMLGWAGTIPNVRTRQCSVQLKLRTMFRYLFSLGIYDHFSFIGIRSDEAHRKIEILANVEKGEYPKFPLVDNGTTVEMVNQFWDANDFKLNIPNHMGNCDLCFLKAKWKILSAMKSDPDAAKWWSDWEDKFKEKGAGTGATWIYNKSYKSLMAIAEQVPESAIVARKKNKIVNSEQLGLDINDDDVACSCSIGGYRHKDDED